MEFFAEPMEAPGLLEKLAEQAPQNPFCSRGYFRAMQLLGADPWIAGLRDGERLLSAAGVFITRGRLNSTLEVVSLPAAAGAEEYWSGLLRFSADHGITQIEANSFASSCHLPPLPGEETRRLRHEFVIDLTPDDIDCRMSKKHHQRVRKAVESGLRMRRSRDHEACHEHFRIVNSALDRRRQRGEQIEELEDRLSPFLESGAGELFQVALRGEPPVASALVLRSGRGAYYHTSGALPEAMALGTSDFLIHNIAHAVRSEGAELLNLGGADPGSGLAQFKLRFGCSVVSSTAVTLYVGPRWRKKLTNLDRLVRERPQAIRVVLFGDLTVLKVYSIPVSAVSDPAALPGTVLRALSKEEMGQLDAGEDGFGERQRERLRRFGESYAYGVFVDDCLAHISWLLPQSAMRLDLPAVVPDSGSCAEITGCETLPEFRGRSIYGFAIRSLCRVAAGQGISQIYMKTNWHNKASQKGILKAGLKSAGLALLLTQPLLTGRTWVFRLFRLAWRCSRRP
jgi:hypothetical protein